MVGAKNHAEGTKIAAIAMHKAKVPLKKISATLGIARNTLWRILSHAKKNPTLPLKKRKVGSGRKLTVDQACLSLMSKHLARKPCLTALQLKLLVPALAHMSIRQIQHICLKRLKLPSQKMAAKPLLTDQMKEKRLVFARAYGHWTAEDWKFVMFSDESHFELQFNRATRCRRPAGSSRFNPLFTKKTVKHPPKVMAWGCFSWKGRGALVFLDQGEMMNGERYRQILDDKLQEFMVRHGMTHFLQDGAPCHRSKLVKNWFSERPDIVLIDWPGNSPDLNPIENCWSWMKHQLRDCQATSIPELKERIMELWCQRMDDIEYLKALVESMPRRLAAVIESGGNVTKY